jgi:membrane protease YdiL (CAAX protease family)
LGFLAVLDLFNSLFKVPILGDLRFAYVFANLFVIFLVRREINKKTLLSAPAHLLDLKLILCLFLLRISLMFVLDPISVLVPGYKSSAVTNSINSILISCILGPVMEEIIFRGYFFNKLLTFTSATRALLVSSLVFGLVHLKLDSIIHATITGCLYGWVFYRSGSLVLSILLHSINNVAALMYENSELKDVPSFYYAFEDKLIYCFLYGACLLSVLFFLYWLNTYFNNRLAS